MVSFNFLILLLLGLIVGSSSQNDPNNYIKLINQANSIEYKITGNIADFSQLHSPPLGPLSSNLGSDYCRKGVYVNYYGKNYTLIISWGGLREETCTTTSWRNYNSVQLLGSASSKVVHLYPVEYANGYPVSYTVDVPNITLPNTNSLFVVGNAVSATFYTLPNYGGASVCVTVGTNIYNLVSSTTTSFGFTTIRSVKFGCNSNKIIQPPMDTEDFITEENLSN